MSTSAPFDAGIPVLTEVLREVPAAPASAPPAAPPASAPPTAVAASPAVAAAAPVAPPVATSIATPVAAPVKPAVWRTGTAAAVPVSMLAVPADIDFVIPAAPVEAAPAAVTRDTIDVDAIERALGERILEQLMPRVDALVAQRIEQVLLGLGADLRAGLGESVAQVVAAAVQKELAALRAQKV